MDALKTPSNRPQKYTPRAQVIGQIRDEIRQRLLTGEWKPGMVLPSRRAIAGEFNVNAITVQRALVPLIEANLLVSDGRGTFVSETAQDLLKSIGGERESSGSAGENGMASLMQNTIVLVSMADAIRYDHKHEPGWATVIDDGVIETARRMGLHAMTLTKDTIRPHELEHVIEAHPLGVVTSDMFGNQGAILKHLKDKDALNVPVTMFGDLPDGANYDSVGSDHNEGAYLLTNWLLDRGCKRIAMLLPTDESLVWSKDRRAGHVRAMRDRGMEPEPPVMISIGIMTEINREYFDYITRLVAGTIAPLILADNPVDAFMVLSDSDVACVATACRMLRKTPNVDVAIVGYDNYWSETDETQWEQTPPLATIDKCNYEIGRELVRLTVARSRGELPPDPIRVLVAPRLVLTASKTPAMRPTK